MDSVINIILKYDIKLLIIIIYLIMIALLLYADMSSDLNLTSKYIK